MSDLFSKVLALHSAPAICGIKASNLINCNLLELNNFFEDVKEVNDNYNPSLYIKILKIKNDKALILVYKKETINLILTKNNLCFLKKCGYPNSYNIDDLIDYLIIRLNSSDTFPHEIGIFLGYDLDDVLGFIKHKKSIYSGLWKIYSDKERKIELFNKYKNCTKTVLTYLDNGYKLDYFIYRRN